MSRLSGRGAELCQRSKPLFAAALRLNHADEAGADRRDTAELEHVALQALYAVRAVVDAIEERRHAHGHDDARRASLEQLGPQLAGFALAIANPGRSAEPE